MTMTPEDAEPVVQHGRWHRFRARSAWFDWDLFVGVIVGVLVVLSGLSQPEILRAGPPTLYAILGVAAGVLGIVLGALSIFVALLNDDYMTVLLHAPGGTKRAWTPFVVVSTVGVVTALTSLLAVIVWTSVPPWGQATLLAVSAGLLAWSLSGIAQLVGITKFHGEMRLELFAHMQDARRLLRDRKKQDRPA